jgi:hypothetical protein
LKKESEADVQLARAMDFKNVFSTPEGRRVLRYMMKKYGFLRTTYIAGDYVTTAFNEGQRAVVIDLIGRLKVDIKKLEQELFKEQEGDSDVSF